jgi:hypothetical protein
MKLTGHKTEAVYRRYAIVAENDLREAGVKLAAELGPNRDPMPKGARVNSAIRIGRGQVKPAEHSSQC